ncbi:hypothetical protein LO50_17065 [Stutzerimonas stutzeri]|uniref:Uncharacterized protein n=1 Tax=Stutzerimonas stutzeri TaxID=316 RepID=A0A0D7E0Z2_STUST|nr:hypothetical protein LO50_17065 [Stutzerimonas stutzeri]
MLKTLPILIQLLLGMLLRLATALSMLLMPLQTALFLRSTALVTKLMVWVRKSMALVTRLMTWATRSRANPIQRARGRALAMLMALVMKLATRLPI